MRRDAINTIIIGILLLLVMFTVGCSGKPDTTIDVQSCTASQNGADVLIECPDGSKITLPPQIIQVETITTVEVPIMIETPCNRRCKKYCKKD